MKKLLKICGAVVSALVVMIALVVFIEIDFSNDENLDVFVKTKMESMNAKGLALVFIKNGEISYSKNYGYQDPLTEKAISGDTIFHIASVSKTVTGAAIMKLYEQGLVELDVSINSYLPFEIAHPNFPEKEITLRMLLQHKSSLIDNDDVMQPLYTIESGLADSPISLDEFIRNYFLPQGKWYRSAANFTTAAPGQEYSYSNAGTGLLGYIVEQVTKQPFNEFTQQQIFAPLGMASAGWFSTDVNLTNMAVQYAAGERLKPYGFPTYPDGALKVSIHDYAKFFLAIINNGTYEGKELLTSAAVKEMLPENHDKNLIWANNVLSEFFIDTPGAELQGHTGGDPGSFSVAVFNPENGNGMIVFINGTPALPPFSLKLLNITSFMKRLAKEAKLF